MVVVEQWPLEYEDSEEVHGSSGVRPGDEAEVMVVVQAVSQLLYAL